MKEIMTPIKIDMKIKREFLFEEREKIEILLKKNYSMYEVAQTLNRSRTGIRQEIAKNGGPLFYSAAEAQKRRDRIKEEKKALLSAQRLSRLDNKIPEIEKLYLEGRSRQFIRRKLFISWNTLIECEKRLGIYKEAQEIHINIRLDVIEETLKILTEEVEKLYGIIRNR